MGAIREILLDLVTGLVVGAEMALLWTLARHDLDLGVLMRLERAELAQDATVLLLVAAAVFVLLRLVFPQKSMVQRLRFGIFSGVTGGLVLAYVVYYAMDDTLAFNTGRLALSLLATIFPPALFYLFLATRRMALLNGFLTDINRLGLFGFRDFRGDAGIVRESGEARERRLTNYLDRFQAAFGTLSVEDVRNILDHNGPGLRVRPHLEFRLPSGAFVPLTLVTLFCGIGWLETLPPLPRHDGFPLMPVDEPVSFAFMGAYFFSIQSLVWRYLGRDLTPDAYVGVLKRFLLAVVGVWFALKAPLVHALSEPLKLALAFVIGVFPVVLWELMSGVVKAAGIATLLPSMRDRLPLDLLDGMNIWHQARLEDEDVSSIQNMATADFVDLLINTRFNTHKLVDWIDQAILLAAIGPVPEHAPLNPREVLRKLGIHSATELLGDGRLWPDMTIPITDKVEIGLAAWVESLRLAIIGNPNYHLIRHWKAWGRPSLEPGAAVAQ